MDEMPTAAELMASKVTLTPTQTALVLSLFFTRGAKRGQPDRRQVLELVDRGVLTPVDPSQPNVRWTFSVSSIRRYLERTVAA